MASSDDAMIHYSARVRDDAASKKSARSGRGSVASIRRKPAPVEAATETETDDAQPAGGFAGYSGRGNGREPTGAGRQDHTTSDSTDYVDYAAAGGARKERITSTDDDEASPYGGVTSDDAYAGPGRQRNANAFSAAAADRKVLSGDEYTTDNPTTDDAAFVRGPRLGSDGQRILEENEGPCYANLHIAPTYPEYKGAKRIALELSQMASFAVTTLAFNGLLVLGVSLYIFHMASPFYKFPPAGKCDKAWERRITGERFSARTEYYIEFWGYDCEVHDVETEDGFIMRLFRIVPRRRSRAIGPPVLIQHGLLSNSATWVMNEEKSLPFMLAERGFDVWLGNIRTNYSMPHRKWKKHDPQYHAWAIREIALYDVTAQIEYVYDRTGQKILYVGHSQGCSTMYLALSNGMRPDIGHKMACFVSFAPAMYAGTSLKTFPLNIVRKFTSRSVWSTVFGIRTFYPIINLAQQFLPAWLFGHFAVPIFHVLFGFHPHNWAPRQIPKFFRSVPVGNSSELLYYYMANFSYTECVFDTTITEPWFPSSMPPLAVFYGELDTLVKGAPLVERLKNYEPHVDLRFSKALPTYEDFLWGLNVVEDCYLDVLDFFAGCTDFVPTDLRSKKGSSRAAFSDKDSEASSYRQKEASSSRRNDRRVLSEDETEMSEV